MFKRAPKTITLLEVKTVIDGPNAFERCVLGLKHCSKDNPCSHHGLWNNVRKQILDFLKSTTLEDLTASVVIKHSSR